MVFALSVPNKAGLWAGKPTAGALNAQFAGEYGFGSFGPYNIALPATANEAPGKFAVWGAKSPKGRGFELACKNEGQVFEVSCRMPATMQDLQDMFTFISLLAQFTKTEIIYNIFGDALPVRQVKILYTETAKNSNKILHDKAVEGTFVVTCLLLPLRIPENVCRNITNVPNEHGVKYFSSYIEQKQRATMGYLAPQFYKDKETGEARAAYVLDENVQLIVPQKPFVPYGEPPLGGAEIKTWTLHFRNSYGDMVGKIDYTLFLERLRSSGTLPFDDDYIILKPVTQANMQQILEQ